MQINICKAHWKVSTIMIFVYLFYQKKYTDKIYLEQEWNACRVKKNVYVTDTELWKHVVVLWPIKYLRSTMNRYCTLPQKRLEPGNQLYFTKTSGTVYLCQINIEALGKRPHRGQVANNQASIFIVHSIRVHPVIERQKVTSIHAPQQRHQEAKDIIWKTARWTHFNVLNWEGAILMMLRRNFLRLSALCMICPVVSTSFAWCVPSDESSSFWDFMAFSVSIVVSRNHWAM